MKVLSALVISGGFLCFSMSAVAEEKAVVKKAVGHCEKLGSDGSTEDIEAKDKADCKTQGGKWSKSEKGAHGHDHKKGDKDGHTDHKDEHK